MEPDSLAKHGVGGLRTRRGLNRALGRLASPLAAAITVSENLLSPQRATELGVTARTPRSVAAPPTRRR